MFNTKTKKIALSALLVAINFVYVTYMFKIDLGAWSFTPFSHIFIMLGTFISPYVGIFAALGTLGAFMVGTANYFIWLRAGSHIFFVLLLIFLLKKIKLEGRKNYILISVSVAVVHALFEILAVYAGIAIGVDMANIKTGGYSLDLFIWLVVGIGTFLHSMIDFFAAAGVMKILRKSHVLE